MSEKERCSDDLAEQVGSPAGSCDAGPVANLMAIALDACDHGDAACSPAYAALQKYGISNLDLQQIYKYRIGDPGDRDGRRAACRWVVENLESLERAVVPKTYPRQRRDKAFVQPLTYFSTILAATSILSVVSCVFLTKKYKKAKVMVSRYKMCPSSHFTGT